MSDQMRLFEPQNRFLGSLSKIGIRPAIDGRRRGIRESLEGQTMALARAAWRSFSRRS